MNLKDIKLNVDANTDKLSAKLKAIAKHTQALADELDGIDEGTCFNCGSDAFTRIAGDEGVVAEWCTDCDTEREIEVTGATFNGDVDFGTITNGTL